MDSRPIRKTIKTLHGLLPPMVARVGNSIDFVLASRPRPYRDPQHPPRGLPKGVVTISLDFELAWAWVYAKHPGVNWVEIGLHERAQVPKILRAFDEFGVPATWATVGHLFLEECKRDEHGRAHPDMPRLAQFENAEWRFAGKDWYDVDPCTSVHRDPAWYAPDLIEDVLGARAKHEVGCHGFSHAGFGPYCPADVAAAEIEACRAAMKPYGLEPSMFVFPGNDEGNFRTLASHGVRGVRAFPRRSTNLSLPVLLPEGLWGVPVSSALSRGGAWTLGQRLGRLKRLVDEAGRTGLCMHLWLHPSLPQVELADLLVPFLRYCAELRERGLLEIMTMGQLVAATAAANGPVRSGGGKP